MSTANTAIYRIRAGIGDKQGNRWTDTFIIEELNAAITRMLSVFKRNSLDYGMGRADVVVLQGESSFALPSDFRGAVGLYNDGSLVRHLNVDELETTRATSPLAVWAVEGVNGVIKDAPKVDTTLTLRYWQQPPALTQPASEMPWGGVFDTPITDYVRLRLANYDEMTIAQDQTIFQDVENNVLLLARSRNPSVIQPKGWLGG